MVFVHVALLTYKAGLLGSCRWPELKKNMGFDGFRRNLRHRYVSIKTTSFLFIMFILLLLKDNEGTLPRPFFLAANGGNLDHIRKCGIPTAHM